MFLKTPHFPCFYLCISVTLVLPKILVIEILSNQNTLHLKRMLLIMVKIFILLLFHISMDLYFPPQVFKVTTDKGGRQKC